MATPGQPAAFAVRMCEPSRASFSGDQRELGAHIPPTHSPSILGQCSPGGKGDYQLRTVQVRNSRKTDRGRTGGQGRRPPPRQVTACRAGGWRAELTHARRGQSGAHNGTFPPGVSCQLGREHGAVARGAAALWSGREKQFSETFPLPQKAIFKGL